MQTIAKGVTCPDCRGPTRVIQTELDQHQIRRTRICKDHACHSVFTTVEDVMAQTAETAPCDHHETGMPCPTCGGSTTVAQTRRAAGQVRRRRRCHDCDDTFRTKERPDR